MLIESEVESGAFLREIVNKKAVVASSIDPTWKIELALVSWIAGAGGAAIARRKVMEMFPSETRAVTLTGAATQLTKLRSSDMCKCLNRATQTELKLAAELLDKMLVGQPPKDMTIKHSEFMTLLGAEMQWFATVDDGSKVHRGRQAIAARYEMVSRTDAAERSLNMLADLHTFKGLLSAEQEDQDATWTKEVLTKLKVSDRLHAITDDRVVPVGSSSMDLFS